MNGQMTNYDLQEILEKDRIAKEFINQVNPYQTRPSLGIDLRALAKRAKKDNLKILLKNYTFPILPAGQNLNAGFPIMYFLLMYCGCIFE